MTVEGLIGAAVVGVLVGVLSGLLGIGGGTIMVPIFRLGFGLQAIQATATSLFTIIPTSLSGCITHVKNKTCIVPVGLAAGLGGAVTSPVGVWLASISPAWLIMLAAAVIIGYSAVNMLRKAVKKPAGKAAPEKTAAKGASEKAAAKSVPENAAVGGSDAAATPAPGTDATTTSVSGTDAATTCASSVDAPAAGVATDAGAASALAASSPAAAPSVPAPAVDSAFRVSRKHIVTGALIGLGAGVMSGYVGVGGGFIMVPLFLSLLNVPMKKASGTSLIAVTILAIPGVIEQAMMGNVDFLVGIAMAVGSIPGAVLGAQLVKFVPERALRILFGAFLLVMAVILVGNELLAG